MTEFLQAVKSSSVIENPTALLTELEGLGVRVERVKSAGKMRLRVSGPEGALTGATLTRIRRNAAQLRDRLRSLEAKTRAERAWAHQRGLSVPAEAPEKQADDHDHDLGDHDGDAVQ